MIATEASRLRERRLTAWDAQRDAVREAAQVVLDGPGRLGLRRAAVASASAQLTTWADTWRPYLPSLPSDAHRIAVVAGAADHRPRLHAAFDAHARRHAEATHPEDIWLLDAADTARAAHDRARRELAHARRAYRDRLTCTDTAGQPYDPVARLADAERDIGGVDRAAA